ncbi:MAG: tRNA (adenosine(37)-N6)-threonylcarbamoyltransferase complex transferase subunit TsaD [Acidobacteriota bacterium]
MTTKKTETEILALGIETSCDDTACAVVTGRGEVLSSVVSSQLAAHRPYGGVVPEIASREHLENWPAVSTAALHEAGIALRDVDVVAATKGPGLIGSLLVGLSLGKSIAYGLGVSFQAVNHLEGHLYSPFLRVDSEAAETPPERFVGLIVSGGHTTVVEVADGSFETLAETRDDAMGEVFDKVGKSLKLPYPQGPVVDGLAELGKADEKKFSIARFSDGSLDFSYSGLKSQTLLEIRKLADQGVDTDLSDFESVSPANAVLDLLASFRAGAVAQIIDRLERLLARHRFGMVAVSGGVAANRLLRPRLEQWGRQNEVDIRLVPMVYAGDNAAMIAYAGIRRLRMGIEDDPRRADAASRLPF